MCFVEISKITFKFNSFNKTDDNASLEFNSKKKFFFWIVLFKLNFFFKKINFCTKKYLKRTITILKSPFHYKTPKHKLQYSFFMTTLKVSVDKKNKNRLINLLKHGFNTLKPHKIQITDPKTIVIKKLI